MEMGRGTGSACRRRRWRQAVFAFRRSHHPGLSELAQGITWQGTLDGELLAGTPDNIAPFQQLQQRLNRKKAGPTLIGKIPVFFRAYDILRDAEDLRQLPIETRRDRLATVIRSLDHPLYDYSAELPFADQAELSRLRAQCREGGLIEGLMLKAKAAPISKGVSRVSGTNGNVIR